MLRRALARRRRAGRHNPRHGTDLTRQYSDEGRTCVAKTHVTMTVNGQSVEGLRRAAHAADSFPAREPQPDRSAYRLRDQPLWRVHCRPGWSIGESPAPCSRCRPKAPQGAHHRRYRRPGRHAARAAGGLSRDARPAMRVLHPGMIVRAYRLLHENPNPHGMTKSVWAISGYNLCRCTGYPEHRQRNSIHGRKAGAAAQMREAAE